MLSMLTCPNCGAPLPRPMPGFSNLTCAFCGVTSRIDGPAPQATSEAKKPPQRETVRLSNVYIEAVKGAKASGESFHALVERLAAEHIGELVGPRVPPRPRASPSSRRRRPWRPRIAQPLPRSRRPRKKKRCPSGASSRASSAKIELRPTTF